MELYESRKFMIFNVSELGQIDFSEVLENSPETVRRSVDGAKTFVKWDGDIVPHSVDSLITKEGPYSYSEIIEILNGSDWVNNNVL